MATASTGRCRRPGDGSVRVTPATPGGLRNDGALETPACGSWRRGSGTAWRRNESLRPAIIPRGVTGSRKSGTTWIARTGVRATSHPCRRRLAPSSRPAPPSAPSFRCPARSRSSRRPCPTRAAPTSTSGAAPSACVASPGALYDPIYRSWFRVEWEGLEKIPTDGGALLVANHAGAIPSDAPVIMHGIETELERPGLRPGRPPLQGACRSSARCGPAPAASSPTPTTPTGCCASSSQLVARVPRGHQGPGQDLHRALPAAPLRPGRLRRDRHAGRRAGRADRRGRRRGVDADPVQRPEPGQGARRALRARSPPTCCCSGPLGVVALLPGQVQAAGARPGPLRRAARPAPLLAAAGSWTRPRPSASGSRRRCTTCCSSAQSVWFG